MLVIDVSKWQGEIDFEKVRKSGVKGVMIRAGYGKVSDQIDPYFFKNYDAAKNAGLYVGCYWYSYAYTNNDMKAETELFYATIKDLIFDLPVCMDIEENKHYLMSNESLESMFKIFADYFESRNYFIGFYVNRNFIENKFNPYDKGWALWLADWTDNKTSYNEFMRQYTNEGKITGINGNVDLNNCTDNIVDIIKDNNLNNVSNKNIYFALYFALKSDNEWQYYSLDSRCYLPSYLQGLCIFNLPEGSWYRVHLITGVWLDKIYTGNLSDYMNGWAGKSDGTLIDAIQIYYNTPKGENIKYAVYQCGLDRFYPEQYDVEETNGQDGYAGVFGVKINQFRLRIGDKK